MAVFDFCPNSLVPHTIPREPLSVLTMNGWTFSSRPTTPYQRKFRVKLFGLKWFLNEVTEDYDEVEEPEINARALELFYEEHETWKPFTWTHPHLGVMTVRFASAVEVPPAPQGNNGLLEPLEITLIEHNPGY